MKIEEVISLAHQAIDFHPTPAFYPMNIKSLEMFAYLVAEREREACAKLCEDRWQYGTATDCSEAIRARGKK